MQHRDKIHQFVVHIKKESEQQRVGRFVRGSQTEGALFFYSRSFHFQQVHSLVAGKSGQVTRLGMSRGEDGLQGEMRRVLFRLPVKTVCPEKPKCERRGRATRKLTASTHAPKGS